MKVKELLKKFYQKRNLFIIVCVLVLTLSTIGISYSAFFTVKSNTDNQTLTTGELAVSYSGDGTAVFPSVLEPISDRDGLNQTNNKIIHIANTGTLDSEYVLTVGYDMDKFKAREGAKEDDILTPIEFVKIAVYEYDSASGASTPLTGPLSIGDLPVYEYNQDDQKLNRYSLLFGSVGSATSGNATKNYQVKVWLSDKTTPSASNSFFYINSEIVATVANAKEDFTFTGKLLNADATAVANATISFQNGSRKITTGEDGSFTIEKIPEGTYNILINDTISGNITIKAGAKTSVAPYGPTFTAVAGSNIFQNAYTYGTTINNLMKANSFNTSSDAITMENKSYNLSPTYELVIDNNSELTPLNITISDTAITNMTF